MSVGRGAAGNIGGGSRRGYVEDLATKDRRYFSVLAEAAEFIAVVTAMPLGGAPDLSGTRPLRETES